MSQESAENLINSLQKAMAKLQDSLNISERNVRDFEELANIWMKSYNEEVPRLTKQIATLKGVIEELEKELDCK